MSDKFEAPKLDYGGAQKLKKKIRLARFVRLADETENAVETVAESATQIEAETVSTPESETIVALEADAAVEPKADAAVESEAEATVESEADAAVESEPEATVEPVIETSVEEKNEKIDSAPIDNETESASDSETNSEKSDKDSKGDTENKEAENKAVDGTDRKVEAVKADSFDTIKDEADNDRKDSNSIEKTLSDIDDYDNSDPDIVIENLDDDDDSEFKPRVVRLSSNRLEKSKNNSPVGDQRKNDKTSAKSTAENSAKSVQSGLRKVKDNNSSKNGNTSKVVNGVKNAGNSKNNDRSRTNQTNYRQELKKQDNTKKYKSNRTDYERFDGKKSDGVSILLKILLAVLIIAFAAYIASVIYFMSHFSWAISAEGEDQLYNMTAEDVKIVLQNQVQDYFVAVEARDLDTIYLSGHDIDMTCSFDGDIKDAIRTQNPWLWFAYKNNPARIELPVQINFDEELLAEILEDAIFSKSGRKPINAKFVDDPNQYAFILQPEDNGTVIDKLKATAAISDTIKSLGDSVNLDAAGVYTDAEVTAADLEKNGFYKDLINLCETVVNVDWHGIPVVIDKEFIYPNIKNDGQKAWIEYEPVLDYVKSLSRKYDLFGQPHKFTDHEGHEINVVMGSYGWRVDREATAQGIYDLICKGGTSSYEPVYRYEAYARGESDIGDSYAEINLTRQHMYLYVDGKVVVESDFVSGNPMKGNGTHVGIYGITYKEKDATLKGQGYSSPVSYWMPFNGNEGMHDASWRSSFGGRIYKGNGSHGCINLPVNIAGQIFEYVDKGFPVIVFTDPEDPAYQESDDKVVEPDSNKPAEEKPDNKPTEDNKPLYDAKSGLYYIVDSATNAPIFLDPETMQPTDVATAVNKLKAMQEAQKNS